MTRYYGIYAAKNNKYQSYINKMFKLSEIHELKSKKRFEKHVNFNFQICPSCV